MDYGQCDIGLYHKEFRELLTNAVQEVQQGVSLGIDMVVAVGKKPTG